MLTIAIEEFDDYGVTNEGNVMDVNNDVVDVE